MNKSKIKIASYLLLIFVAGALSGGAVVWKTRPAMDSRPHGPPPDFKKPGAMRDFILKDWEEKFDLTEEQINKIKPLLETGMKEVRALQESSVQQVRATMQKTDNLIAEELTPEQKVKFLEWQREREKHRSRHRGPGPGRPGSAHPAGEGENRPPPL